KINVNGLIVFADGLRLYLQRPPMQTKLFNLFWINPLIACYSLLLRRQRVQSSRFALRLFARLGVACVLCLGGLASALGNTFTGIGSLPVPVLAPTATLLPNGKLLVCGGRNALAVPYTIYPYSQILDPATGTWSLGPFLNARSDHAATLLLNGLVL